MKKILTVVLALVLTMALCAPAFAAGGKIGVAMPTQDLQRWNQDGDNMKKQLEAAGYEVDVQYANNEVALQVSQIENMILGGCKVLVIASIDGSALGTVLAQAKEEGIPVIAYDRLIMKSDAVSYYATFDNYKVGTIQGKFIEEKLGLAEGKGPFNIELFAGSPDDNNAMFFFQGAWDVLKPYVDKGQLVIPSGQTDFQTIAISAWKSEGAQNRMDNLLTAYYSDGKALDAVLSPNDSLAIGIANSLTNMGFSPYPILTGQDCDKANMKNILAGKQSMSIFKDTRTLAAKVVGMVDALMQGTAPEITDTKTYDNGDGKIIPSYLCDPVYADKDNYKELLIDSGYYTEADITG
jgi:putative multiple sugar transport system substrate-binding protein